MAPLRLRRALLAAAFAAGALAGAAHAQQPSMDVLRERVERGRSEEIWAACAAIDRVALPEADLWCGIAAVDMGRAAEGVLALERYVLRFPDDVRARLELARAYYYAGDDVAARRSFETVRAAEPPDDVRAGIDRYLEALSAREAGYRTRVFGYVEAGGGYDSNVNAGVAQADIALPVLGPVTVASFGVERGAGFGWLAGSVQLNHPVAPGVSVFGGLVANGQFNAGESEFDIAQGALTLGANWQRGQHSFFGSYVHGELGVGGDRYRSSDGVVLEWRYAASELLTTSVTPQVARLSYAGANGVRDSDFYALGLASRRIWLVNWQPVLNLSAIAGRESNRNDRPDLGRDVYGASADLTISPAPEWAVNAAFSFQRSTYIGSIPLLAFTRNDDNYAASVGAIYFFSRTLSGRVEAQYFQNDSNLSLYEYERYVVAAKLRYDFK